VTRLADIMATENSLGEHKMVSLEEHVLEHLPRCIADVKATPTSAIDRRDCTVAAFALSQKGTSEGAAGILGFPLGDYNPDCKDDPDFISPLTLRWPDATENVIFDSDIHGYHGEMQSSAKLHGEGTPRAFTCQQCGHGQFNVVVQFDYWDACDDLCEDEPDLPIQDYFCNIMIAGKCVNCGTHNAVLDMDL